MRQLAVVLLGSLLAAGLGCSGSSDAGDDGSLTCEWLAGDNCWKQTANQATSCLPPESESGVLSADNSTCTYPSGAVVTFTPPLVFPLQSNPTWNFTITTGGQPCLHYEDSNGGFELTVADQTVSEGLSGAMGMRITCPDGVTHSTSNALGLLGCDSDSGLFFGGLPGNSWSSGTTSVSFSLLGAGPSALQMFDCVRP